MAGLCTCSLLQLTNYIITVLSMFEIRKSQSSFHIGLHFNIPLTLKFPALLLISSVE
jgi:hypothetical protein